MQLNFYSCGEGFPLIVLHGLLGSSDNWQFLSKKFGEQYNVFALDLRNHGASPHDDVFDYSAMAEDLSEFMEARHISEAFLLGHSMGGKTAMQFATTWPHRVRKLIVADIAPKAYPPYHKHILDALWSLDLSAAKDRAELDKELALRLPEVPLRSFLLKNLMRHEDGKFTWKIDLETIREKYGNITAAPNITQSFTKPTLFIRGTASDYILPEDESDIRNYFPAAEFAIINGAGHWLHAEKPLEFLQHTMEFLEKE